MTRRIDVPSPTVPTVAPRVCDGRLTLTTALAVTTADVTGAGTLYFTPFRGNLIGLYGGGLWKLYVLPELSLSLTLTSGKNYDVFVYNNAGVLTLELSAAWTNDTTRADAIALQDGVYVKSGTTSRRLVGTIRASGTNTTEDSAAKRYVFNAQNRMPRDLLTIDTTDTWSYTTATWRQANANTANKVEVLIGLQEEKVEVDVFAMAQVNLNNAALAYVGVGVDSTTVPSGLRQNAYNNAALAAMALNAHYGGFPGLGYHALNWLEKGADIACLFYGDNGAIGTQCGITGTVWA